jgi:hypothetical protein
MVLRIFDCALCIIAVLDLADTSPDFYSGSPNETI